MPTDMAIVMTLFRRPSYTARVLEALAACDGIDGVPVFLMCEPVNEEVQRLALTFRKPCEVYTYANRVGCNRNTLYALSKGFEVADRVVALEDDTVPGRDFLRFVRWGLDAYENDKDVFSVCGYQRTEAADLGRVTEVIRENWFTPWGWATWRDRWQTVSEGWPARDDQVSWDAVLHRVRLGHRCEVRPVVARIQNIGGELGAHVPSIEWHERHHLNRHWIESVDVPPVGIFCEVSPGSSSLRRNHPC